MTNPLVTVSVASLAISALSLLYTVLSYHRLDTEARETFSVIGADEGNHEARLERLEKNAGLQVLPSPSEVELELENERQFGANYPGPTSGGADREVFVEGFDNEHENTELQGSKGADEDAVAGV